MNYRNALKNLAFFLLDQRKQRGFHLLNDVRYLSKATSKPIDVIFDVGANIGQSTIEYKSYFPNAEVHAFEPINPTFEKLKSNVSTLNSVYPNKFALSSSSGSKEIYLSASSLTNSLRNDVTNQSKPRDSQIIYTNTLDNYLKEKSLDKIDFLKTDTEGHDLEVLKGGSTLLDKGYIYFLVTEVTFDPKNKAQTRFIDINEFLWDKGYGLVGFYDWRYKNNTVATIHYCNALYMLDELNN